MGERVLGRLGKAAATFLGVVGIYAIFLGIAFWLWPGDEGGRGGLGELATETGRMWLGLLRMYPASLELYAAALMAVCGFGVPLGIFWGGVRARLLRGAAAVFYLVLVSVPAFWLAYVGILYCVNTLEAPVLRGMGGKGGVAESSMDRLLADFWFVLLPAGVLSIPGIGRVAAEIRRAVAENMKGESMTALTSRGLSRGRRLYRYALPASWWAVLRSLREVLPAMIGASLLVEWIFDYPGVGRRCYEAIIAREYQLLGSIALLLAITVLAWRLLTELVETIFFEEGRRR